MRPRCQMCQSKTYPDPSYPHEEMCSCGAGCCMSCCDCRDEEEPEYTDLQKKIILECDSLVKKRREVSKK